jgi:organic radical activating enzyme
MKERVRYKPEVIKDLTQRPNSWFKFVVSQESDWEEIKKDYLDSGLIERKQIILMPEGQNQEELSKTRELTADVAIREGVRFSDRLHITIWNIKTGV